MLNANRLINDFRKQTKTTIWRHMRAMSVNYAVYSNHLEGLSPFLSDKDIYIYMNANNMVVVCLDCNKRWEKRIYEESENMDAIIYRRGCEPLESIVWKLKEMMQIMKIRLSDCHHEMEIYGVLMTEAIITNADELEDYWEANNIKVIDGFSHLRFHRAEVNADDSLTEKQYYDAATDASSNNMAEITEKKTEEPQADSNDEFEKLLMDFINSEMDMEVADEETPKDNPQDEDEDADESANESSEDIVEDIAIPCGDIEQNMNLSVKVEILRPIANPREELDKLIGCADIKRRMDELVALTSYNKLMHEAFPQSKQHEVSLHSVFLGRPGTGKTTVCKIFGSLLRQAGALSKGHVVVCDRGTFIGTLWGDEERSMRQVLEMAQGGVLMIDEAYLLNGKHENDPGKLVIQLLMNILADETQRDIAVVLCGYKEQMQKLLDTNPGLQSRFPNRFEFTDFTVDELLEITRRRVKDYDYTFTTPAWEKYSGMLAQAYQVRNPETWGNARFVANQLERIYIQHAARCVKQHPTDKQDLLMLTPEDILPIEVPRQIVKIGFL